MIEKPPYSKISYPSMPNKDFKFTSTAGETQNDFVNYHIESGGSKSIDVPLSAIETDGSRKITNTKELFGVELEDTMWDNEYPYLAIKDPYGSFTGLNLYHITEDNFSEAKKIIKLYVEGVTSLSSEIFDKSISYIDSNENLKKFVELSLGAGSLIVNLLNVR